MHADPKSAKKTVKLSFFFVLLGSACVKAAHRMLMKLTLDVEFTVYVGGPYVAHKMPGLKPCIGQSIHYVNYLISEKSLSFSIKVK